ncbi:hypothetical protein MP228_001677 [Amoeboaphelidium protococcarum]|nr:hypothetical protein MP228_001677 [Amoeboaphelidium protococcarum]
MVLAPMRLLYGLVISVYLALQINANAYPLLELLPLRVRHPLYDAINHELFIDQLQNVQCHPLYEHIELVQVSPDTDAFQLDMSSLMAELTVGSLISTTNPAFLQQCLKPLYDALDIIDFQDATQGYKPLPIISIVYLSSEIMSGEDNEFKQKLLSKIYEVATPLSLQRDQVLFAQGKPLLATQCLIPVLPNRQLLVGLTNWVLSFNDYNFGFQIISLITQRLDYDAHADYMAHITSKALTHGKKELSSMIFQAYYYRNVDKIQTFYVMSVKLIQLYDTKNSLEGVLKTLILVHNFNRLAVNSKEIKDLDILAAQTFELSLVHCKFVSAALFKICQQESPSTRDFHTMVIAFRGMNDAELQRYFRPPNNGLQGVLKTLILVHNFNRLAVNSKEIKNLDTLAAQTFELSLVHCKFVSAALFKICQQESPSTRDFHTMVIAFRGMNDAELQRYFRPPNNGLRIFLQLERRQQWVLAKLGLFTQQELSSPKELHLLNFETRFALIYRQLSLDQLKDHDQNSQAVAFNQEIFLKALVAGVFDQSIMSYFRQYYLQVNNGELDLVLLNEDWSQCRQGKNVLSRDAKSYCILLGRLQNLIQPGQDKAQSASGNELIVKPTQPIQSAVTDNISIVSGIPFIRRVVTTGDIASALQDYTKLQPMLSSPLSTGKQHMDGVPSKNHVVATRNTASSHQDYSNLKSMQADPLYSRQQQQYNLMGDTAISYDSGFPVLTTGAQFVPQYQYAMPVPHSRVVETAAESKVRVRPYKKRQKRIGSSGFI